MTGVDRKKCLLFNKESLRLVQSSFMNFHRCVQLTNIEEISQFCPEGGVNRVLQSFEQI